MKPYYRKRQQKDGRDTAEKITIARYSLYYNLAAYLGVNGFLLLVNLVATPDVLWVIWPLMGWGLLLFLHGLSVYFASSVVSMRGRLKEKESELAQKHEQILWLSEKLKVYLPHQVVESIAKGHRDTLPDYKRQRLTVFFSDVQGFTLWVDKLEPEDTRELLNCYLSDMSAIARKWGGTLDKFIGDAIMIFFGDPEFTNHKDHAIRCVSMALEMQEKMFGLRKQWEEQGHLEPLHVRMGINTGYATVGNFGSQDRLNYTALGSTVNLASRIESACEPDKITISHTTWSLIKNEITCQEQEEINVKGFSEPVKIYEVIGLNSGKI